MVRQLHLVTFRGSTSIKLQIMSVNNTHVVAMLVDKEKTTIIKCDIRATSAHNSSTCLEGLPDVFKMLDGVL